MVVKNPKRIALWTGPRDLSMLLFKSFRQRTDANLVDEPLFPYYVGYTGLDVPFRKELFAKNEHDPIKIIDILTKCDLNKEVLVVKNKSSQIVGLNWEFMLDFKNVILISEPSSMIKSNIPENEYQTLIDCCYEIQYQQVLYLMQYGIEPIVLDLQRLLKHPEAVLDILCKKLNLDFDKSMLSLSNKLGELSLSTSNWATNVLDLDNFKDAQIDATILPNKYSELEARCQIFYQRLKIYAL